MKLKYISDFHYNDKSFGLYQGADKKQYIKKETEINNYKLLKKIADTAQESDNLNKIKAFYQSEDKLLYFVELINAKTLTQYLDENHTLTLSNIKNIIYQLCIGLKQLHKNDIVHRDIKPDNILIKPSMTVILIDYDITRIYEKEKSQDTILSGTKGYAAPEQFGFSQTTIQSDIYSLGITIGELLDKLNEEEKMLYNHVVKKSTMIDPKNRYNSVDDIINEISNNETEFFDIQLEQIKKGKKLGLTQEQISIYAKPRFSATQMGVIKHALNEKISNEVINIIADSRLNSRQMWQIKRGYLDGLSLKKIINYAKPIYSEDEMTLYRSGLNQNFEEEIIFENIKLYLVLSKTSKYSSEQLSIIRKAFYKGLKYDTIKPLCFSHLCIEVMEEILILLLKNKEISE